MLKISIIAFGNKMPAWVNEGVSEFKKRLQEHVALTLIELPLMNRSNPHELSKILVKEMDLMVKNIPQSAYVIALDVTGTTFTSHVLALKLEKLQQTTSHICFLMGGPEGFLPELLEKTQERWSLSALTLPHTLARIVLLESVYRGFSILANHPYHK